MVPEAGAREAPTTRERLRDSYPHRVRVGLIFIIRFLRAIVIRQHQALDLLELEAENDRQFFQVREVFG